MKIAEPGLEFWLSFVESEGGAWEAQSETSALAILPPHLQDSFKLAEETLVSTDPEVVREDGGLLMIPGHPALEQASTRVLEDGDVGRSHLAWPTRAPPTLERLVELAREHFAVDHGRIDPGSGQPVGVYLPTLRVGVMVSYQIARDQFQEQLEVWIDASRGIPLPQDLVRLLQPGNFTDNPESSRTTVPSDLNRSLAAGHLILLARASARNKALAKYADAAMSEELDRTTSYYRAILESIFRRRAGAATERALLMDAQAEATRMEEARRLAEVKRSYQPSFEIRPFRLHLVGVPALTVPVHVRRGERLFALELTWLLRGGTFNRVSCPGCGSLSKLVAGREKLGCTECLPAASHPLPRLIPAANEQVRPGTVSSPGKQSEESSRPPGESRNKKAEQGTRTPGRPSTGSSPRPSPVPVARKLSGRKVERVIKEGAKLAMAFWMAAAGDQRWRSRQTDTPSPLACLHQLYGSSGAFYAIGAPTAAIPDFVRSVTAAPDPADLECTTGSLLSVGEAPLSFTLRWSLRQGMAVVSEVLPYPMITGKRIPQSTEAMLRGGARDRLYRPPEPRVELDPVQALLWKQALPVVGLPLVLRCLALRDRACRNDEPDHPDPTLAAALLYVTLSRAGRKMTQDDAGAHFGVPTEELAGAAKDLRAALRTEPVPWG